MSRLVVDTSVLMSSFIELESLVSEHELIITTTVAMELDNHKESDNSKKSFQGRSGLKFIQKYENSLEFYVSDMVLGLAEDYDKNNNDNKILSACITKNAGIITHDRGMLIKAMALNIPIYNMSAKVEDVYKGYQYLDLDMAEQLDCEILSSIYSGKYYHPNISQNEYLIIRDISENNKTLDILRYFDGEFLKLKQPDSKVIKAMNDLQRCALDILNNDDIPIKIIAGGFGSGKTFMATKIAIDKVVKRGKYGSIMVLRNPTIEGEQIGYLKGTKEEKTDDFFKPFVQHLDGNEFEATSLVQRGLLTKEIVGYIKGLSIGNTFIIVDEAEDLDMKLIKMCGSRIEETSSICFVGDYKQANTKYSNGGLIELIEKTKNNKLVGTIILEEDLRSEASKVFAEL